MLAVVKRNPRFRRLWLAQVVSQLGDWLNRVAALTLIGELAGLEAALGLGMLFGIEMALRLLPSTILGTLAGSVADRFSRKKLMIGADLLRSGVVLCLLTVREAHHLPILFFLLFTQMAISIFFESARTAAMPSTLRKEDFHDGYALMAATWSFMLAVGALCGGLLVGFVGIRGVFLVDSATYIVSALLLLRLPLPPTPEHPQPFRIKDVVLLRDVRRGLDHVRELGILPVIFAKTCWGVAGGFLIALGIAGRVRFGGADADGVAAAGAAGLATGLLYASRGLGTGIGPILARYLIGSHDRALLIQIRGGFFVGALGYFLFTLTDSLPLALASVMFAHLGGSSLWVATTTFWQRYVDDAFRGRVYAIEFICMTLSTTMGGVLAGLVYDFGGESLTFTMRVTCATVCVTGVIWVLWSRRIAPRPIEDATTSVPPNDDAPPRELRDEPARPSPSPAGRS